jgi:hypothetical protein
MLHDGGGVLRSAAPSCSWGGRIRASGARICPLGASAGSWSSVTGGGSGASPAAWRVVRHRHLCPGVRVSVRGGGACLRSGGSSSTLRVAGAAPHGLHAGTRGRGLGRLASATDALAAIVVAAIAPTTVVRGSGLGDVQRCAGGALVARSATVFLCELVPATSWWCPWRWSCGGAGRVSLLGDNDAGENPFLLTRSGDSVVGATTSFPS